MTRTLIKFRVVTDGMAVHHEYWHRLFWFVGYWLPYKSTAYNNRDQIREIERIIAAFVKDPDGKDIPVI